MTRERDCIQENANKYIVKNCDWYDKQMCLCMQFEEPECRNISDCAIKQVIEECKRGINYSQCNCGAIGNLVNILQLFDIEEINK